MANNPLPASTEIVIVGAGVIGLTLALDLQQRGRQTLVLERAQPGAGASRVAGGLLAPTSAADLQEPRLIDFALDSLRRYPALVARLEAMTGVSCGLRTNGTLWLAFSAEDDEGLDRLQARQEAKGIRSQRLGPAQLLEWEPKIAPRVISGLHILDDLVVDPRRLIPALVEAVQQLGGRIVHTADVREVESAGSRVQGVRGMRADGTLFHITCPTVVIAAGAWASVDIASPAAALAVRPIKGQIVRLRGPQLLHHTIRTPDGYLIPHADGEILVGGTVEDCGFDESPTAAAVLRLLQHARAVVPAIGDLAVQELSVGFRPAVRDYLPIIGPLAVDGLFVAVGHFRNGILLAPATAHYLAEWITSGRPPPQLDPFAAGRLARPSAPAPLPGRHRSTSGRES